MTAKVERRLDGRKTENTREQDIAYHKSMMKFMYERGYHNLVDSHLFQLMDLLP